MRLIHALPLLIAIAIAWLAVRHMLERRRARLFHERLRRQPSRPRFKPQKDSERSEMRAYDDATTVARTISKGEPKSAESDVRSADGTRSRARL